MPLDVTTLSPKQLEALIRNATKERKRKAKREPIARVRQQIVRLAKAKGYTVEEVFGMSRAPKRPAKSPAKKTRKASSPVAAKYRHPDDPSQTWSGRGRQPRWLAAALAAGATLESFRVAPTP